MHVALGFCKVVETVLMQIDKMDTSGNLRESPGEQSTRFVQFSPARNKLLMSQSGLMGTCFGALARAD